MDLQAALDRVSEAADDGTLPASPALVFVVPGDPVPKGRPRISARGGYARAYTPKATRDYEAAVCAAATAAREQARGPWPIVGPVRVEVSAVFARPGRLFRQADPDGRVPHDKRPDLDNVLKAILDGMDQAGVWGDDGQVCELAATQWYGRIVGERRDRTSEDPHVVVRVWRVG